MYPRYVSDSISDFHLSPQLYSHHDLLWIHCRKISKHHPSGLRTELLAGLISVANNSFRRTSASIHLLVYDCHGRFVYQLIVRHPSTEPIFWSSGSAPVWWQSLRLPCTYWDIYACTCRRGRDIYTRKYSGPSAKHRSAEIKSVCYHGKFTAPNVNGRAEFDAV